MKNSSTRIPLTVLLSSLVLLVFLSCGSQSTQSNQVFDERARAEEGTLSVDTTIEERLETQVRDYLNAVYHGDSATAMYYMYPDLLEYLARNHKPPIGIAQIRDTFALGVLSMGEAEEKARNRKKRVTFEHIVRVNNRVDQDSIRVRTVVVNTLARTGSEKLSEWEEFAAVSTDRGLNWKFLPVNMKTPSILRMNLPAGVADRYLVE